MTNPNSNPEAEGEFSPKLEVGASVVVDTGEDAIYSGIRGTIAESATHEGQEYYRVEDKSGDYRWIGAKDLARTYAMDDTSLPEGTVQVGGRVVVNTKGRLYDGIMGTIADIRQREDGQTGYKVVADGSKDYRWIGADSLLFVIRPQDTTEEDQ